MNAKEISQSRWINRDKEALSVDTSAQDKYSFTLILQFDTYVLADIECVTMPPH